MRRRVVGALGGADSISRIRVTHWLSPFPKTKYGLWYIKVENKYKALLLYIQFRIQISHSERKECSRNFSSVLTIKE